MLNLIIAESKNDTAFFKTLIAHLNFKTAEVDHPIFVDDDTFRTINGSDPDSDKPTSLITKFNDIQTEILKKRIRRIGVILDLDDKTVAERLEMVNSALRTSFSTTSSVGAINAIGEFATIKNSEWEVSVACYFTNYGGRGELETLLKNIVSCTSVSADCLSMWRLCLEQHGKKISDKEYDKFWISNYIRFDTCSKRESKQAEKYCSMKNFTYILQKGVFNLDSPLLNDLKRFLLLFRD